MNELLCATTRPEKARDGEAKGEGDYLIKKQANIVIHGSREMTKLN